ncbi:hypothetical protein HDU96_010667 [Phlyctochytrium bullatum]|nr:hypothetical protein HDU96_010667 [Phlyctochytrium bullatum]
MAIAIRQTLKYKDSAVQMILLDSGAGPNVRCLSNRTPLHVLRSDLEWRPDTKLFLDALVQDGADLDCKGAARKSVWQKLCGAALRDASIMEWVLERAGMRRDKLKESAETLVASWQAVKWS